ncbi:TetR/AcrR family transcriptional regulator [Nocardia brasiliensis]|uniref:TetR/AcrR family transcriptional regulator n=1 Tax=Nocardia brasiliensis TaxID=37326 RepID=UPI00189551C9|nr:TetR/AcrR family transcriptional regulator [Nocardia brasiliensis]MBF6126834.1 TetR/AcrR family transcriptional regulator C-terminal domain-containing protein [Nocardia brasiliensis]
MNEAPVSRRARPAKAPLSRAVIIETGLRILDQDGLAALTMRRVAQDLDTGAASLYVYVANRDDLMAAMLDHVLGMIEQPVGGTWRERLVALVQSAIAVMSRHEGVALVALGSIPTGENALVLVDRMLALLAEGGVAEQTNSWAVDLLFLYITAAAAEQSAYNTKGMRAEQHIAEVAARYAALPAERYPMVVSMRESLTSGDGDARAQWALRVLIDGILGTPVTLTR